MLKYINSFKGNTIEDIDEFGVEIINQYHLKLKESGRYSLSTLNQSVNAIKFYYEEVVKRQLEELDQVIRPRKEHRLPNILSEGDIRSIIKQITNLKHRTIILLIYSAGLRISEAINLKISDINSKRGLILIRGSKGKKDRYTILSEKLLQLLRKYYVAYRPKEYLFEGNMGEKYSAASIRKILRTAMENAGIGHRATVHTLRHSFATHLLEQGTDLRFIQELLGHNSSKTTEIYTHVSNYKINELGSPIDDIKLE